MKWFWFSLALLFTLGLTNAIPHASYPSFASHEDRIVLEQNLFMMSDDVVYKTGYYSINGANWVPFTLTGTPYIESDDWLSGSTSYSLPESFSGLGEHYIIVFSCSLISDNWDCHNTTGWPDGFWQLHVINNTVEHTVVCGLLDDFCPEGCYYPLDVDCIGMNACVREVCDEHDECEVAFVTESKDDDGCCPAESTHLNDNDCPELV